MGIQDATLNYLLNAYSDKGEIAKRFEYIFSILNVDKILISNACFEIYYNSEANSYFENNDRVDELPSYKRIKNLYPELSDYYFDRLAFAFVVFDINKNMIHFDQYHPDDDDIRSALHNIEIINFQLGSVVEYLNNLKYFGTENKSRKSIHSLGGISRAKKYEVIKKQIFKDWETGNFHSYAECARKYADKYRLANKTIEDWLSKKFRKPKDTVPLMLEQ